MRSRNRGTEPDERKFFFILSSHESPDYLLYVERVLSEESLRFELMLDVSVVSSLQQVRLSDFFTLSCFFFCFF